MTDYPLESRDRLPDALRVLLEDYPREAWEADPGFGGLVQFWLQRHLMFRRMMELMSTETETMLDGGEAARFGQAVSQIGSRFVGELQMHHQIEDAHYFPVLAAHDPRIRKGFEILDKDHHALDGHLAGFVSSANAALQGLSSAEDPKRLVSGFQDELARLTALMDRHLEDEEELVVPVILAHGTAGLG